MTSAEPALDLPISFGARRKGDPVRLTNPVIAAAGTLGTGVELQRDVDLAALGAIVTPTIGRRARRRRSAVRLVETPAGLFLAGPYPQVALRAVIGRLAPLWATWTVPVIASLSAGDADECVETAAMLADHTGIAALELELISIAPRLTDHGSADDVRHLCRMLSDAWPRPLIVKLPFGQPSLLALIDAATAGGADALTLGGGFPARVLLPDHGPDRTVSGRVVGPATRPLALNDVAAVCTATHLPVIASGGITCGADALAFMKAGARAVQVGSASLRHPAAAVTVVRELDALVQPAGTLQAQPKESPA